MTKQKKGFGVFICSLIPGAGELYMGFFKKGLSLMVLFFGIFFTAVFLRIGELIFLLPIVWLYSFFEVHNLKSLTEEEFMSVEDNFVLASKGAKKVSKKSIRRWTNVFAVGFILAGLWAVANMVMEFAGIKIPTWIYEFISLYLPSILFAIVMIGIGIALIVGKKKALDEEEE